MLGGRVGMIEGDIDVLPGNELMDLARTTGRTECFGEIFRCHRRLVFAVCRSILGNSAEAAELTQDTFLRAMIHADRFRGGSLPAWLVTIARHLCLNRLEAKLKLREIDYQEQPEPAADGDLEGGITVADTVRAILRKLSVRQRLVMKLFYLHGYTYKEITGLTGFPE